MYACTTRHQFGKLVDNTVINNQNQLWDVRNYFTRDEFRAYMHFAREADCYFGSMLHADLQLTASDKYRFPFCIVEGKNHTYWDEPGAHLTIGGTQYQTEEEFHSKTFTRG